MEIYHIPMVRIQTNTNIKVANRVNTDFWKDEWHKSGKLQALFSDIYSFVSHQQKKIADHWTTQGWNSIFRRQLNDREMQRVEDFFNIICQFNCLEGDQHT